MTLVEVLVALAIMAAVAAAILALISQNTRFVAAAEDKLIAGMAADREIVEALAGSGPFERGAEELEREFAGRRFRVTRTVTELGVEKLLRIDIVVRDAAGRQALASATTIRAESGR
jgi:general secretion pathway protein I